MCIFQNHSSCQENCSSTSSPWLCFPFRKTAPVQAVPSRSSSIEFSIQKSNAIFSSPQSTGKCFSFYSLCKNCERTFPQPPSLSTLLRILSLTHFLINFNFPSPPVQRSALCSHWGARCFHWLARPAGIRWNHLEPSRTIWNCVCSTLCLLLKPGHGNPKQPFSKQSLQACSHYTKS